MKQVRVVFYEARNKQLLSLDTLTIQAGINAALEDYPQMACSTCLYGIRLPFATDDFELVGAYDDIVRWLGS